MKNLIICGILICLFSSCLEKLDPNTFKNTKWELIELPGKTLSATAKATLNFDDNLSVNGKSFCNNYGGKTEVKDNKIYFLNVFGTKMFCQETDGLEQAYLKALNETNGAKIVNSKLHLLNDDTTLLVFTKLN